MISKVKDVTNSNRQLTYKIWLDELNTTPLHDFITIARQFNELFEEAYGDPIKKGKARKGAKLDKLQIKESSIW